MTSFFNTIGTYGVTLMGIWMVVRFIKFSVDIIVHGYALHTIFGWSLWLLGAVWDSVTNLLIHLNRDRNQVKDMEKGLRKEDDPNNESEEVNYNKTIEQVEIKIPNEIPTTSQIYPQINNASNTINQITTTPYTQKIY
ncbi:hypothetical protein PV328_012464 [Microctonus aethiopoides]|uniref:Uncharacterized protein n=1 Tax=Microctonus aethiopoides TaxID=144406 RepID=A0AA39C2Z1_9HYME|nr:hypothetical protein PV328_012464 [Microctonus aethiopoides]